MKNKIDAASPLFVIGEARRNCSMSFGIFILRVVVGLLIAGHGSQKLLGWFGGPGFTKTVGMMKSQGFKAPRLWALLGSLGEFGGGLFFALGLLTPLAAIAIVAAMLMAVVKFHWSKGLWSMKGGYEYPLVLLFVALVIGLVGAGSYSLDALIGFTLPLAVTLLFLLLAIIVVAVGVVQSRQRTEDTSKQVAA